MRRVWLMVPETACSDRCGTAMGDAREKPSRWNLLKAAAAFGRPSQRGAESTAQAVESWPDRPKRWMASRTAARLATVCSSECLSRWGRKWSGTMLGGPGFCRRAAMVAGLACTIPKARRPQPAGSRVGATGVPARAGEVSPVTLVPLYPRSAAGSSGGPQRQPGLEQVEQLAGPLHLLHLRRRQAQAKAVLNLHDQRNQIDRVQPQVGAEAHVLVEVLDGLPAVVLQHLQQGHSKGGAIHRVLPFL